MRESLKLKIAKSSIPIGLLLFCIFIPSILFSFSIDTLIIDGKTVVINRVVEYDTVSIKEFRDPADIPKPKRGIDWLLGVESSALGTLSIIQSDLNNLETVDEFTDAPYRFSVNPGVLLYGGYPINDLWTVYSGLGFNSVRMPYRNFGLDQLDDSLHQFISFDRGELSQITRYDFGDLGAELDTLSLSLTDEVINLQYLEIPLLFQYSQTLRNNAKWRFDLEFGINVMLLVNQRKSEMISINSNGNYELVPLSGQKFTSTLFGVRGAAGFSRNLSHNFYVHGRLVLKMPLNSPTDPVSRIQADFYQTGIQVGIMYIFKK